MVRLPCSEVCADVSFHVGFIVVARISVRHGVFLGIVEKPCAAGLGRSVIKWVFEPEVVCPGGGRAHSYRDFLSGWLGRQCLVLLNELVYQVDRVGDRCYATAIVRGACTDPPSVPKVLLG